MRRVYQSSHPSLIEPLDPYPHGGLTQVKRPSDCWHLVALAGLQGDAGPFHITRGRRARLAQACQLVLLVSGQGTGLKRHGTTSHHTGQRRWPLCYNIIAG